MQNVLVTGVARALPARFAADLQEQDPDLTVVGTDLSRWPGTDTGAYTYEVGDIRSPSAGELIRRLRIDTLVHLGSTACGDGVFTGTRIGALGRELTVIGTMQLLAACQKASTLRRLVVKSSAAVYGSSPRDPALFSEEMSPKSLPRAGFGKDSVEVETYVRGFSRRRPDVGITTLRLANIIGPGIRTSMTDYFALPVVPAPLGFDARLQFVHEADASAALVLATTAPEAVGNVNVAGAGVITVQQAAAMVGRPILPVPLPAAGLFGGLVKRVGLADFSDDQMQYLAYGRGLDTTRMHEVLGFEPDYTTREAFRAYAEHVTALVPGASAAMQAVQGVAGSAAHAVANALNGRMG